jgi:hypothetical protein
VPHHWCDFITMVLLDPSRFEWAKALLGSKAWSMIQSDANPELSSVFTLPSMCPVGTGLACSDNLGMDNLSVSDKLNLQLAQVQDPETQHEWAFTPENNNIGRQLKSSASTSMMYMKRKRAKAPMVVSEVRRSKRLKGKSVGYKAESCVSRTCFCCSIDPPTLSPKVIRSLGVDFCKMSPKVTSDEALKSKPVGKKKAICRVAKVPKASKNKKCEDEDKTKKKCRKN